MEANNKTIKRWNDISPDPNCQEVLSFRRSMLVESRQTVLIYNRISYLCSLAKGKNILDIGVVEHFHESSARKDWLHGHICRSANTCLGVDILEEEVKLLRKQGYNVVIHDVTQRALPQKFNLIVAGDVVEHLNNASALLRNAAEMLEPGGRIVISTPNPWYANAVLKNVFEGEPFTDSADHVAWFDAGTLCEIANRSGLLLDRYAGVMTEQASSMRSSLFFRLAPLLTRIGIRPEVFAKTMIYEFVLTDEGR